MGEADDGDVVQLLLVEVAEEDAGYGGVDIQSFIMDSTANHGDDDNAGLVKNLFILAEHRISHQLLQTSHLPLL